MASRVAVLSLSVVPLAVVAITSPALPSVSATPALTLPASAALFGSARTAITQGDVDSLRDLLTDDCSLAYAVDAAGVTVSDDRVVPGSCALTHRSQLSSASEEIHRSGGGFGLRHA